MNYHLTALVMGGALAGLILWLVRQDHLHVRHALFWMLVAAASAVLGVFPRLSDTLAAPLGIAYGPLLPVLLGLAVILVKALTADIALTRLERDVRRLNQHLALLEQAQCQQTKETQ